MTWPTVAGDDKSGAAEAGGGVGWRVRGMAVAGQGEADIGGG